MPETLFTWRDVDRILIQVDNPPWRRSDSNPNALKIECLPEAEAECIQKLSDVFGVTVSETRSIPLRSTSTKPRRMLIEFDTAGDEDGSLHTPARPLWENTQSIASPPPEFPVSVSVCAFFSYKGGVGRTSLLSAVLGEVSRRIDNPRVLVIDADFEAPGLTWLLRSPSVDKISFSDILALVHDTSDWKRDAMPLICEEIERCEETIETISGPRKFWFLPTIRNPQELFMPPVTPEMLVKARGRAWVIGDLLCQLADSMQFDVILVDLRAGVTESSSPLLLDSRIEKIPVTSCNQQSIDGTLAVLEQIGKTIPNERLPSVAITMIPPGRRDLTDSIRLKLSESVFVENVDLSSLGFYESDFAQELLHFDSLDDFVGNRVPGTDLGKSVAPEIVDKLVGDEAIQAGSKLLRPSDLSVKTLEHTANQLEFAESNADSGLLPIEALRNIMKGPKTRLPNSIVIGKKGSGKTFAWGQLIVAQKLSEFSKLLNIEWKNDDALAFPLLSPKNLSDSLREHVAACEKLVSAEREQFLSGQELGNALSAALDSGNSLDLWISWIAKRLGFELAEGGSSAARIRELSKLAPRVLLVVDGLEDAFQVGPSTGLKSEQASILRGLIQDLPILLKEESIENIGLIVFVRQDLVSAAIRQNSGHFLALHRDTSLSWDQADALRLVVWMSQRAQDGSITAVNADIASWSYPKLREELEVIWGERMGGKKEA